MDGKDPKLQYKAKEKAKGGKQCQKRLMMPHSVKHILVPPCYRYRRFRRWISPAVRPNHLVFCKHLSYSSGLLCSYPANLPKGNHLLSNSTNLSPGINRWGDGTEEMTLVIWWTEGRVWKREYERGWQTCLFSLWRKLILWWKKLDFRWTNPLMRENLIHNYWWFVVVIRDTVCDYSWHK